MAIIHRRRLKSNFTVISNAVINDTRLSFQARGVYVYLLSKPDDWTIRHKDIQKNGKFGRDSAYKIINELLAAGYLVRSQERKSGQFGAAEYDLVPDGVGYEFDGDETDIPKDDDVDDRGDLSPLPENTYAVASPCTEIPYTANQDHTKDLCLPRTDLHYYLRNNGTNVPLPENSDLQDSDIDTPQALPETNNAPLPVKELTPDQRLFERGTAVLGERGRGLVAKLKKHFDNDCERALKCIELAAGTYNPQEYIGAIINKPKEPPATREKTADDYLDENRKYMGEEAYWAAKNIGKKS